MSAASEDALERMKLNGKQLIFTDDLILSTEQEWLNSTGLRFNKVFLNGKKNQKMLKMKLTALHYITNNYFVASNLETFL